jgi:hypothetical protein
MQAVGDVIGNLLAFVLFSSSSETVCPPSNQKSTGAFNVGCWIAPVCTILATPPPLLHMHDTGTPH